MNKPLRLSPAFALVILYVFLFHNIVIAQFSAGPRSGSVFDDDNIIGSYTFSSPGNAAASDNNRVSASAILSVLSGNTHYLKVSGFGFSIPSGTIIKGIVVEVEKSASNISILATVTDNSVRLIKGGTITSSNYNASGTWPASESYYTYGGSSDTWGTTWTVADINSPNFGVAFSASINGIIGLFPSARIDHIRVTVYYDFIIVPLRITHFTGTALGGHSARLQWTTANNDESPLFNIQKSNNGREWINLNKLQGEISPASKTYQYTDADCSDDHAFYRLHILHASGGISYSPVVEIRFPSSMPSMYPNPATDYIFIQYRKSVNQLECFSLDGRKWPVKYTQTGKELVKLDIRHLPRGTYLIHINNKKDLLVKY